MEAKAELRAGGSTYSVMADSVKFGISFGTKMRTPVKTAKFSVVYTEAHNLTSSSTYTCKK